MVAGLFSCTAGLSSSLFSEAREADLVLAGAPLLAGVSAAEGFLRRLWKKLLRSRSLRLAWLGVPDPRGVPSPACSGQA